jgi:hypothetical protein
MQILKTVGCTALRYNGRLADLALSSCYYAWEAIFILRLQLSKKKKKSKITNIYQRYGCTAVLFPLDGNV